MKKTIISIVLLASVYTAVQAEILELTGTVRLYDFVGNAIVPVGSSITGEYDTDNGYIVIHPWMFFGAPLNSAIEVLPPGAHSHQEAGMVAVGPGQLGGLVQTSWSANDMPSFLV